MAPRSMLQTILESICENVYFQPPASIQMAYPAIVYNKADIEPTYADNHPYIRTNQYELTVISRNPDEGITPALATLPMCRYERFYVADNLNHDVFTLYF